MTSLAVITPSWRPDAAIFDDLHRSVLECTPPDTVHHVVVPWLHKPMFAKYEGPRCRVWTHPELVPRRFWRLPGGVWLNMRQPWPPIRGWVMQQAVKIATAARMQADVVLLIDSDVTMVRPATEDLVVEGGRPVLFRDEAGVHDAMPRHVMWHQVARELLGLPSAPEPPLPDYVTPVGIWEPATVRAMQRRIERVTGKDWLDAFTGQLHVSEFIVYGVFVDHVLSHHADRPATTNSLCHNNWAREPLDEAAALEFADRMSPEAIAMMISSHSRTPRSVRHAALRRTMRRAG